MSTPRKVWALVDIRDEGFLVAHAGEAGHVVVDASPACPYPTVCFDRTGRASLVDPDEVSEVPTPFGFTSRGVLLS